MANNLPEICAAAFYAEQVTGCPGLLLVAQCGLESGWLKSSPGNNCFGIKQYTGCTGRQLLRTTEWFTDAELSHFLSLADSRTADLVYPVQTNAHGRHRYSVQDWFATFPSLGFCFTKRAAMWDQGPYAKAATTYKSTGDFPTFVRAIAPIYATAPNYADQILAIVRQGDVMAAWLAATQSASPTTGTA